MWTDVNFIAILLFSSFHFICFLLHICCENIFREFQFLATLLLQILSNFKKKNNLNAPRKLDIKYRQKDL